MRLHVPRLRQPCRDYSRRPSSGDTASEPERRQEWRRGTHKCVRHIIAQKVYKKCGLIRCLSRNNLSCCLVRPLPLVTALERFLSRDRRRLDRLFRDRPKDKARQPPLEPVRAESVFEDSEIEFRSRNKTRRRQ